MGIELVKLLFARHAAGLSARALVVLGYMAVHALDKPNQKGQPARLYFAGWEPLALALGYDSLTRAAEEKVRRALKELRESGLIEPMEAHAQTGTRQSYRVLVGAEAASESPTDSEGQSRAESPTASEGWSPTGSEGQEPHRIGVKSPTDSEGPRKDQESGQDSSQESISHSSAQPHLPRAGGIEGIDEKHGKPRRGYVLKGPHQARPDDLGYCLDCSLPEHHRSHGTTYGRNSA